MTKGTVTGVTQIFIFDQYCKSSSFTNNLLLLSFITRHHNSNSPNTANTTLAPDIGSIIQPTNSARLSQRPTIPFPPPHSTLLSIWAYLLCYYLLHCLLPFRFVCHETFEQPQQFFPCRALPHGSSCVFIGFSSNPR